MPGSVSVKDLVLVGGGHAQVYVLQSFARRPMRNVRLTLVARDVRTLYSGMLPGLIAGHYLPEQCLIDLAPLAARAGARLIHDEASGLARAEQRIICRTGTTLPYDIVSIDIGSSPILKQIAGAERFATPIKPISTFRSRWERIHARATSATDRMRFLTVGGGAGGVEATLAIHHRLGTLAATGHRNSEAISFTVVTGGELLPDHNISVRRRFRRIFSQRGIDIAEHETVREVDEHSVICASGRTFDYDELIWVTEAGGAPWLKHSGLVLDQAGFIVVDPTLQSVSDPRIFAAGDVASYRDHPRPKAGVFAVRQGPPLAGNLRRALNGQELVPFIPQREFLSLISTGDKYAVASRGEWSAEGRIVWWFKDQIDRRWIRQFQDAPLLAP